MGNFNSFCKAIQLNVQLTPRSLAGDLSVSAVWALGKDNLNALPGSGQISRLEVRKNSPREVRKEPSLESEG